MPAPSLVPSDALALGPGYLYWAPLASSLPSNTVAGPCSPTRGPARGSPSASPTTGHEFSSSIKVDPVEVEEALEPVKWVTTGRETGIAFALAQIHATNMKRAINGGTITVTGSGCHDPVEALPPAVGAGGPRHDRVGVHGQHRAPRHVPVPAGRVAEGRAPEGRREGDPGPEFKAEQPTAGGDPGITGPPAPSAADPMYQGDFTATETDAVEAPRSRTRSGSTGTRSRCGTASA